MRTKNNIFNYIFLFNVLAPYTNAAYVVQFLCILYLIFTKSGRTKLSITKLSVLFAGCIALIIGAVAFPPTLIDYIKILNIFILVTSFPLTDGYLIKDRFIIFCVLYILFSQVVYMLNITVFVNLFDKLYPYDADSSASYFLQQISEVSGLAENRFSGFYHNPNECGKYLTILLATYLLNNIDKKINILYVIILFIPVFLTGSRTTFLIASILILLYVILSNNSYKLKVIWLSCMAIVFGLVSAYIGVRSFKIAEDLTTDRSFSGKLEIWINYIYDMLQSERFIPLIFGNFNSTLVNFDADIGYVVAAFGFTGLATIVFFLYDIFKRGDKKLMILAPILLWCLTASIFFAIKTVIVYFIVLGNFYSLRKKINAT